MLKEYKWGGGGSRIVAEASRMRCLFGLQFNFETKISQRRLKTLIAVELRLAWIYLRARPSE